MCDIKLFSRTLAQAEYHTRGLFSAVVLIPKDDVGRESHLRQVISND